MSTVTIRKLGNDLEEVASNEKETCFSNWYSGHGSMYNVDITGTDMIGNRNAVLIISVSAAHCTCYRDQNTSY